MTTFRYWGQTDKQKLELFNKTSNREREAKNRSSADDRFPMNRSRNGNKWSRKNMNENNGEGGGDSLDSKGLFWRSKPEPPQAVVAVDPDSDSYYMKHPHRGKCIIFNNKDFDSHTNLNVRKGTESDAAFLKQSFRSLDFDVELLQNVSKKKILETLKSASREDHTRNDCFVCCILTHGDRDVLYGRDGKFRTEEIYEPFLGNVCPTLAGKPKIFIIQACQGDRLDVGIDVMHIESADSACVSKIPTFADFLICYSTVPGFYSWRNTSQGSWFIQSLCEVLKTHSDTMDMLEMMTIVNRKVAYNFQSNVPDNPGMDQMKQVPCITSTLTRKIYFPLKF